MFVGGSVKAQDIHFSQFYMSPLNLNPAMTGVMNCNTRLVANYRNQWAAVLQANAYNTYSVSYDQKIAVGRTDYFGIGGSLWGDVAGELNFGTTQGRVSFSYAKRLGGYRKKANYLVFGTDAAISQRRIDTGDARWPNQLSSSGFDPMGPGETLVDEDFLYADLSAGLLWFSVLDENNSWYVGLAQHHQGPHKELNLGSSLRFALGASRVQSQYWQVGLWWRSGTKVDGGIHNDAMIFSTRFDADNYGIGFSYDYNVSKLRQGGQANGAFEFSLNYLICGPEKRAVYCPAF